MSVTLVDGSGRQKASGLTPQLVNTYAARPAATGLPNGVRFYAVDKAMEWVVYGGAWVLCQVFAPEVTSLPSSPVDQQECVYVASAAAGTKWHLRYRTAASGAYKWEVIGGPPLRAWVATLQSMGGVSYADLSTLGPDITVPLAGEYDFDFGAYAYDASGNMAMMTVWNASLGSAVVSDLLWRAANQMSHSMRDRGTMVAAGQTARAKYKSVSGTSSTWANRLLFAMPVRVG